MKTIANTIIINSQNVKSEHLLAVIIISVFKEESSVSAEVSAWTSSREVDNTVLPKLPLLDNLKSLRHRLVNNFFPYCSNEVQLNKCSQKLASCNYS